MLLKLMLVMIAPDQDGGGTAVFRTLLWPTTPQLGTSFPAGAKYDTITSQHEVTRVEHDFSSGCIWVTLGDETLTEAEVTRLVGKGWTRSSVMDPSQMTWTPEPSSPVYEG